MNNSTTFGVVELSFDEIENVDGGVWLAALGGAAAVVGIAVGLMEIGKFIHDATCDG